jgi:polygalacturonase
MLAALGVVTAGGMVGCGPLSAAASGGVTPPPQGKLVDIKSHGATGDGKTLDTPAINRAVDQCSSSGGGTVYVPPGTYLCGTIQLKSNVTLFLEAGAVILGSPRPEDFSLMPGPSEQGDINQRHLIFARDGDNITLAGTGTIDGNGHAYWTPRTRPATDPWGDVATFDYVPSPRRSSPLLEFYNCTNLRIRDVHIRNASGWTLRPIQCNNVFIDNIIIKNPIYGINTDGIDITCCKNLFISNCLIESGDDAICLKSESPYGGEPAVTKNITITNCVLSCCCNGLKFGTVTRGGFENIVFSNSVIYNEDVPINQRVIGGVSLEVVDGGYMDGVLISNIRMQRVRAPIFIRRGARTGGTDSKTNFVRSIMIDNVHATGAIMTSSVSGLPGANVEDVTLSNIRIDTEEAGTTEQARRRNVPEMPTTYPEARIFGHLPAHGLYARHVTGLRLRNIEFIAVPGEARPALVCDDVSALDVDSLRSTPIAGDAPAVRLIQTSDAFLRGCRAPANCNTYLEVAGDRSNRIVLMSSDLSAAKKNVETTDGAAASAVTQAGNIPAA